MNGNGIMHSSKHKVDWIITLVPLAIIIALCVVFMAFPGKSNEILGRIRFFFGDTLGACYLVIGLGIFLFLFLSLFPNTAMLFWESLLKSQSIRFLHGER